MGEMVSCLIPVEHSVETGLPLEASPGGLTQVCLPTEPEAEENDALCRQGSSKVKMHSLVHAVP